MKCKTIYLDVITLLQIFSCIWSPLCGIKCAECEQLKDASTLVMQLCMQIQKRLVMVLVLWVKTYFIVITLHHFVSRWLLQSNSFPLHGLCLHLPEMTHHLHFHQNYTQSRYMLNTSWDLLICGSAGLHNEG